MLANPKFLNALFAPEATGKKRNTEAIEIAPSQLVSGRIVKYTAAHIQSFAEVKDSVRQHWLGRRGAEEARKEGLAKLAAWKAAPASAVMPAALLVSRDQTQKLPAPVINAALRADASVLPAFVGVDLGAQGYAIVKVNKVVPRDAPSEAVARQERNQYAQWWTEAETLAYYNELKERFKAEILVARPVAGQAVAEVGVPQ